MKSKKQNDLIQAAEEIVKKEDAKDVDPRANKIVFHTTTLDNDYNRIEADSFKIGWSTIEFYVDGNLIAMYPKNSTIIKRIVYPENAYKIKKFLWGFETRKIND